MKTFKFFISLFAYYHLICIGIFTLVARKSEYGDIAGNPIIILFGGMFALFFAAGSMIDIENNQKNRKKL